MDSGDDKREIKYVYPILDSEKLKRSQIDRDISGSGHYKDPDEFYWLFKLGSSLKLKSTVIVDAEPGFSIKVASREDMSNATDWNQIPEKYVSCIDDRYVDFG